MTTIKDISKKCGVSPATVSKALNGYGDIGVETAEMIRKAAQEMHYFPNAAARLLKTNSSNSIGVLFVDGQMSGLTHEYFSKILNTVKEEAEKRGYDITFIGNNLGNQPMSYTEHCRYRKCDGVIIACVNVYDQEVMELIQSEIPTINIDYSFDNQSCVMSDNITGAYELTDYLASKGHRKIAFIHGEKTSVTEKRLVGFYRACEKWGIEVPEEYVMEGIFHDPESSANATKVLMELPNPPTAIMYPDDYSYIGGMNQLEKMGISVPEDVSVVGYDGIHLAGMLRPTLTTYYQDTDKIGKESVRKLVEEIENKKTCIPETIMVTGKLIEGQSVKALK